MARIVAIMLFLCKFFFLLLALFTRVSESAIRPIAGPGLDWQDSTQGLGLDVASIGGVSCQKSGWSVRGMVQLFLTARIECGKPCFQRNMASQAVDYSASMVRLRVSCRTNVRNTQQAGGSFV
jgi:hypothetical protein